MACNIMKGTHAETIGNRFDTFLELKKYYSSHLIDWGTGKKEKQYKLKFKHRITGEEFEVEYNDLKSFLEMTERDEKLTKLLDE